MSALDALNQALDVQRSTAQGVVSSVAPARSLRSPEPVRSDPGRMPASAARTGDPVDRVTISPEARAAAAAHEGEPTDLEGTRGSRSEGEPTDLESAQGSRPTLELMEGGTEPTLVDLFA